MFTNTNSRSAIGKAQKVLLLALVLLVVFASIPQDQAFAFSYNTVTGSIGSVSVPVIYIGDLQGACARIYDTLVCPPVFTLYAETGPIVNRSPAASGAQIIQGMYVIEQWDGSQWAVIARSDILQANIGAYQKSATFAAPYMQPNVARGYFRFSWIFSWFNANGTLLGQATIVSNQASDHVCLSPYRLCESYDGFMRTGGYLTNAW